MFKKLIKDLNIFKKLKNALDENFLMVNYEFYIKYKLIIKLIIFFNKNYISCEIARKKFKTYRNIIVVGLRTYGKPVVRKVQGFAKAFVRENRNAKCLYCETKLTLENATTDHVVSISNMGNNHPVNLVVVCSNCNSEKGSRPFNEYIKEKNPRYTHCKYIFF
jgi:hypothetical protein